MKGLANLPKSLLLLLATATSLIIALPHEEWASKGQVVLEAANTDRRGAVACESKVCSQIGIDLLAHGGNAVDAFIGTQLCVGVIGMYHSGLGGGGFSLIRDAKGNYTVIDYRETAPAAAFEDMYKDNVNGSVRGGLAAGVPGELRGLELAHGKFGVLPWYDVVQPSVRVARDGFVVTEDMVRYMEYGLLMAGYNFLVEDPSWAMDFAPNGKLLTLGETMYRKRYADTLQKVAEQGAQVFYTGDIANTTIATIQKGNGTMTLDDLSSYKVITRPSVNITYRGYKLHSIGVPSGGVVGLSILKTMEGYQNNNNSTNANLTLHRLDEAMRFGYGARYALGDPDYVSGMSVLEAQMLDASKAASIRSHILDNTTQPVENYSPNRIYTSDSHGTSHIVTADGSGMAVSSTTTINLLFGNLQMVPETGIILNNEMNDFSIPGVRNEFGFEPSVANFVRPGKRPLSSITPMMIEYPDSYSDQANQETNSGRLMATVGAAGGSRIISSTTQVVYHLLSNPDRKTTMKKAISTPRIHDQLTPNTSTFEYTYDNQTVASMIQRGHNVTWVREGVSAVQGILLGLDGVFEAASERRQFNSGGLTL